MKTVYYKTSNFIQHSGNVVDLGEYRRKLALAWQDSAPQQDSLARQIEPDSQEFEKDIQAFEETPAFQPIVLTITPAQRRQARRERQAQRMDVYASLAVIGMTMLFALRVML